MERGGTARKKAAPEKAAKKAAQKSDQASRVKEAIAIRSKGWLQTCTPFRPARAKSPPEAEKGQLEFRRGRAREVERFVDDKNAVTTSATTLAQTGTDQP
jgi:hypothetical protein